MRVLLLCLAMMLGMTTAGAADKVNLNPEWGGAEYQPWSVFPANAEEALGPKVVVIFHGFKSAVPNGTFKRLYRGLRDTHSVVGINYNYFDPDEQRAKLRAFAERALKGRDVSVIGTSLGGFWARWFGQEIGARRVAVINPVYEAVPRLLGYVGTTVESERRALKISVKPEDVARYEGIEVGNSGVTETLVILTRGDDRQDYRDAQAYFESRPRTRVVIHEGGHTINLKKHPAKAEIIDFVRAE